MCNDRVYFWAELYGWFLLYSKGFFHDLSFASSHLSVNIVLLSAC